MKLTLGQISNIFIVLNDLSNKTKSFKINYWITRNIKILKESYIFYIDNRQEIYETYLNKNETNEEYYSLDNQGNIVFNLKNNDVNFVKEFSDQMNELIETDCEIEPYLINVEVLMNSDLEITSEQIITIDCLFKE